MDPDLRRGDDVLKVQHLHPELPYHPVTLTRATPPMEGNLGRTVAEQSSSSSGGVPTQSAGWFITRSLGEG